MYLKGICCTLPLDGSVREESVGGYMAAQICINPGTRAGWDIFALSKEYLRGVFFVPPILQVLSIEMNLAESGIN